MWCRIAEVLTARDSVRILHEGAEGRDRPLRAALLRWAGPLDGITDAAGAELVGAAWSGEDGSIFWGWPDDQGRVFLRPGPEGPEACSMLPPALSLALAFRRGGSEPGMRALVIGDGFAALCASAVAASAGCRVRRVPSPPEEDADRGERPDVLIEASGDAENLQWAVRSSRDWGTIYSVAGALASGPLDFYSHIHRRALTLMHVPARPVLLPGEEGIVERCAADLAKALRGVAPRPDHVLEAIVRPENTSGRVTRERSGWGLLRVDGS